MAWTGCGPRRHVEGKRANDLGTNLHPFGALDRGSQDVNCMGSLSDLSTTGRLLDAAVICSAEPTPKRPR